MFGCKSECVVVIFVGLLGCYGVAMDESSVSWMCKRCKSQAWEQVGYRVFEQQMRVKDRLFGVCMDDRRMTKS